MFTKLLQTLLKLAKSPKLKTQQSFHQPCSEPMSSLLSGNWLLTPMVFQLTKKPIQLLFRLLPSHSSSEWCSVIWAMDLFFAWLVFTWHWKEITKVLVWWDTYSYSWECLPFTADSFTTNSLLYQLIFSNLAIKLITRILAIWNKFQLAWIQLSTKLQDHYGIHLNHQLDMVSLTIQIMENVLHYLLMMANHQLILWDQRLKNYGNIHHWILDPEMKVAYIPLV